MKKILLVMFWVLLSAPGKAQTEEYMELMSLDWANLKKYRAENDSILKSEKFPKIVFMGNSITEGWFNMHPEFFSKNDIAGRGIGGQTTPQMLIRFTPDVLDLKPQVVIILAGTNDIAGNTGFSSVKMITDNISAMTILAQQQGIKVILSSILPVYDYQWRPGLNPVEKIAKVNSWLKEFATSHNCIYLDYFPQLADEKLGFKKKYSHDGVHPTKAGYDVMEPLVLDAINKALNN